MSFNILSNLLFIFCRALAKFKLFWHVCALHEQEHTFVCKPNNSFKYIQNFFKSQINICNYFQQATSFPIF